MDMPASAPVISEDHLAVLTTPPFAGLFAAMPFFDEVLVDHRASPLNILANWRIRQMFRQAHGTAFMISSHRSGQLDILPILFPPVSKPSANTKGQAIRSRI